MWKFCFINGGWWLKIESVEQLIEYVERFQGSRFGHAMMDAFDEKEGQLATYLRVRATNKMSLYNATLETMSAINMGYLDALKEDGFVFINQNGGYNSFQSMLKSVELTVMREKPIFPNFTKEDIRVRTWESTEQKYNIYRSPYKYHYYAYLGDMQITDGDKTKWDTKEEAYEFAKQFVDCNERE